MNRRNPSLDVLRAVAILLVVVSHYPYFHFMAGGWIGVDLFFVLSGFLISRLLFSDIQRYGRIRLWRFFFRRGMKIYPAFFVFLVVSLMLWPWLLSKLWIACLFIQNYLLMQDHSLPLRGWGHLWSLAVEEHFYIGAPLLLIFLTRAKRLHWIPRISVALMAVCFFLRIESAILNPPVSMMMFRSHLRVDGLFAGVALGYMSSFEAERFARMSRAWLLPLGIALTVPAFIAGDKPVNVLVLSTILLLNLIGFSAIVCWAVTRRVHFAPLEHIGRYSYSIYLWQPVVLLPFLSRAITLVHFVELLGFSLALGIAMALLVEIPVLKFRDWLTARPALQGSSEEIKVRSDADIIGTESNTNLVRRGCEMCG